ncbi:hypothetical protein JCM1840_006591 [Sporobolomyces johnsonii]
MPVESYRSLGTYVHRQAAAAQNSPEQQTAWMSDAQLFSILVILLSVFCPPLAVFLERGCGLDLLLNVLLSCLGYLPGMIHAVYIVLTYESPIVYNPPTPSSDPPSAGLTWDDILRAASDEDREADEDEKQQQREQWARARERVPSYRTTATERTTLPRYDEEAGEESDESDDDEEDDDDDDEKPRGRERSRREQERALDLV